MLFGKDQKFATGAGRKLPLRTRPRLKLRDEREKDWQEYVQQHRERIELEKEAPTKWSRASSPSQWAKLYGVTARTFMRWISADPPKIRAKVIDSKNIMVDLRDMPTRNR